MPSGPDPATAEPREVGVESIELDREFFQQRAVELAPRLLGMVLSAESPEGACGGRIVEVEAYAGPEDRAAHSYGNRKSKRTAVQMGPGGFAYTYLIYGMHVCFNVVCAPKGKPEAVLIRALEPLSGVELMVRRRFGDVRPRRGLTDLCRGPGNLARALGITMEDYGADLLAGRIRITAPTPEVTLQIRTSPRINVDYAGPDAAHEWRFFVEGSPFVSGPRSRPAPAASVPGSSPSRVTVHVV
jgi:DNA-3-methyladenine glycosylase